MNFEEYVPQALRTEKHLPTQIARLRHAGLGLFTEGGEIATEIKRVAIYEKSLGDLNKNGQTIRAHIAEEIGDVFWYMAIAADVLGAPIPETTMTGTYQISELDDMAFVLAVSVGRFSMALLEEDFDAMRALLLPLVNVLAPIALVIDVPVTQILADNIAKLQERFPDAYSNEAAEARADKGGLGAQES